LINVDLEPDPDCRSCVIFCETKCRNCENDRERIDIFSPFCEIGAPFMTIRKITEYPEKVLAEIGKPVTEFDDALAALCADMFETMYDAEGVGLAAPQIGLNLRLFVMDCDGIKLVAANPEIVHTEGEQSGQEGCLSVGKVPAVLSRPLKARLKAQNEKGEWFERDAEGYAARAFLHETDHCDGTLFIDHLPKMRRAMVLRRFNKDKRFS